jgi:proteasome accessory factor C
MNEPYDLSRTRRLLLLVHEATKVMAQGRGIPLDRAVHVTGAKDANEVRADVEALQGLSRDALEPEDVIDLYVENDAVFITYGPRIDRPPPFSVAEAAVLRSALAPFAEGGGKTARDLIGKLRKAVPEPLRKEADRLAKGLDVALAPPGSWATSLQEAIDRRLETVIEYSAVGDAAGAQTRVVEPRLMFNRDGHWYLAAFNLDKKEEHLFRLDRIVSVQVGTRVFGAHQGPPVARYGGKHLFFESGAEREVILRFRGASARLALQRHGKQATKQADGSVTMPIRLTPGNYLYGVVLGYGGEVSVEGPPDVAEGFRARVAALRQLYRLRPAHPG